VGEGVHGNRYQIQPLNVRFIPQVLLEIEAVHVLVDETERMCLSRVHPHERHHVHIYAAKEAAYMNLVAKPLDGSCQQWI
jgi:hypothetical protein